MNEKRVNIILPLSVIIPLKYWVQVAPVEAERAPTLWGITNASPIAGFQKATLLQIVHFYETYSGRVVYTAHNGGVIARWQLRNDRRLGWIGRSVAAVLNIAYLILCDNTADDRMLPVIIGAD